MALLRDETDDIGLTPSGLDLFSVLGCNGSGDQSCALATSNTLFIGPAMDAGTSCPANVAQGASKWKFVIAHEFGHVIERAFGVSMGVLYNPQIAGLPPICRCDHVTVANALHCMQGMQRWNSMQMEGFAHFYAANFWNSRASTSCTFEYYKEFLLANRPNLPTGDFTLIQAPPEHQMPLLAATCDGLDAGLTPADGGPGTFYSVLPPMFVDCFGNSSPPDPRSFVDYRGQASCVGSGLHSVYTTEFDWLKFYMNLTRNAPQVSMSQLLGVYQSICNATTPCGGADANGVPNGTPSWPQVSAAGQARLSVAQASQFRTFGVTFGVNDL